jgi:hypothetical protein
MNTFLLLAASPGWTTGLMDLVSAVSLDDRINLATARHVKSERVDYSPMAKYALLRESS